LDGCFGRKKSIGKREEVDISIDKKKEATNNTNTTNNGKK